MNAREFEDFFDSTISENSGASSIKAIISQVEPGKLFLFIVSDNRYCLGHCGICDMDDKNNSISICQYFEIVKYLKNRHGIDVTLDWDWFLKQ